MSTTQDFSDFKYFVSSKGAFLVASLVGLLNDQHAELMQPLLTEVHDNTSALIFIFNFRDLGEIDGDAVSMLAQIQKDIRSKPAEVRLCGLRPELKAKLLNRGVIRTSEIYDNLQVAIQHPPRVVPKTNHKKAS